MAGGTLTLLNSVALGCFDRYKIDDAGLDFGECQVSSIIVFQFLEFDRASGVVPVLLSALQLRAAAPHPKVLVP